MLYFYEEYYKYRQIQIQIQQDGELSEGRVVAVVVAALLRVCWPVGVRVAPVEQGPGARAHQLTAPSAATCPAGPASCDELPAWFFLGRGLVGFCNPVNCEEVGLFSWRGLLCEAGFFQQ